MPRMRIPEGNHVDLTMLLQLHKYTNANMTYTWALKPLGVIVDQ